ncbi:MAG TPA: FGGY-family carbohydrate kinase [Candidatus Hydrogenedentes bacterium]|nr:FGGY-family carbohydrate kinase [Candidatus Hydrogenedentota bacterium]
MYLGIDLGTTTLKVAAFDAKTGALVARYEQRLRTQVDHEGKREQEPVGIWKGVCSACSQVRSQCAGSKKQWSAVRGIGLACQGGSTIIADRRTGSALSSMILWNDARAYPYIEAIMAEKGPKYWASFTLRDEPGMGLARIHWLRERRPELFHHDNIYIGAGEYLYFNLTGQWRQDPCHALQSGCYDARRARLSDNGPRVVGETAAFFAPVRQGHTTHPLRKEAARSLKLSEGIPVAGPYMDQEAGFLSVAHTSKQPLACSLGTAWVGSFRLPAPARGSSPSQLVIPDPSGRGRLVIQPLLSGNVTWDWGLETFVHASLKKALATHAAVLKGRILPPRGLVALPWLYRPNPFRPHLAGGGGFMGISPATTKADMFRAVIAGMAYELFRVFSGLQERGVMDAVVLCGGASRGQPFQQLIARLFRPLPAYCVVEDDWAGARGCLCAFGGKPAHCSTRKVCRLPRLVDGNELAQGYKLYSDVIERVYGEVARSQTYKLE